MTKTNNGKLKLETIDRRPVSLGSWCSKRCSLLRVRGLGTRLQLSKSSRTTLARRLATLQQFSRRVAESQKLLRSWSARGTGTILAFSFAFDGGGASKQAGKARQGKASQHAPHFSMRYLTKLTHISPTNKSSPKWRADPTSPTFASWNGLRLWPLAAPHEDARARAQEPTLKSGTKRKEKDRARPHPNRCRARHRAPRNTPRCIEARAVQ
jgi:hypothetical protein